MMEPYSKRFFLGRVLQAAVQMSKLGMDLLKTLGRCPIAEEIIKHKNILNQHTPTSSSLFMMVNHG